MLKVRFLQSILMRETKVLKKPKIRCMNFGDTYNIQLNLCLVKTKMSEKQNDQLCLIKGYQKNQSFNLKVFTFKRKFQSMFDREKSPWA